MQEITGKRISNVVIMGSGEPLDNYENFVRFVRLVTDEKGFDLSARNIATSPPAGCRTRSAAWQRRDFPFTWRCRSMPQTMKSGGS